VYWKLIRYSGLAGAVLLAVAAFLGGALPGWTAGVTPRSILHGPHGPVILGAWLLGSVLLAGAWWAGRTRVPSPRWAYLTAGLWLLPLLVAPPSGSRDVYAYACQGAVYAAGANPYHASVAALPCPWLDSVSPIWRDTPAPYGPLFVTLAGALVRLAGSLTATIAGLRAVAVLGVGLIAWCLPILARRAGIPVGRAVWLALAGPLIAVHLVSGAHNDALMVGLLVAGLAVTARWPDRIGPLLGAGALLGLAVAVKATAGVVIPFALLIAARPSPPGAEPDRVGGLWSPRWGRRVAALLGGGLAAVLAATYGSGLGFGWLAGLSHTGDSVQWTSPSTSVGLAIGYLGRPFGAHLDAVPVTRVVGLVGLGVALILLWRWAWRGGQPLYAAGLALAATVALGPVFHPWYATWPLVVLAATARRTGWFVVPALVAGFLVLPDGTALASFTKAPGALAMTALVVLGAIRGARRFRAVTGPR
jgi:alpha-1,6-mannosyltransferase